MAKKIRLPYRPALVIALFILFTWNSDLHAQTDSLGVLTDTSYFRSGEDDWNLVESVLRNQPANVLFLLKRGSNPNARGEGNKTALMFAAESGDSLLIKILVLNGADMELADKEETSPLMAATLNQHFEATYLLLKKGANPNHQDRYGGSALIYAAALNDYRIADLLLYFGASDTLRDKKGNDALMTAVALGYLECSDVLLQNGISPNTRDQKLNTPLMVAAQYGDLEMITLLLEYKAAMEEVNKNNYTALAHAIRTGETNAVKILVDSGANVNHLIRKNLNLYDLANQQNDKKTLKLLKAKGAAPTPRPDFSIIGVALGNSFRSNEYMMQARISLQDRKFGFFAETGFDVRLVTQFSQVEINDTLIHQYRENRWAWTLGVGKYFTLVTDPSGLSLGFYGALYGMLSFPKYRGISERPPPSYNLMPAAGVFIKGNLVGLKAGAERYTFGTLLEEPWKINITLFLTIPLKSRAYKYKEISYEP